MLSFDLSILLDNQVLQDVRRLVGNETYFPQQPRELCRLIFTTCYMGSENSSADTCNRAKELASQIGRYTKTMVFCVL